MNVRTTLLFTLAMGACAEEPAPAPGDLAVTWKLGGIATCGDWHIAEVQALLWRGNEIAQTGSKEPCAAATSSGSFEFVGIPATTYKVEVLGLDGAGVPRHLGSLDEIAVKSNQQVTTSVIEVLPKAASLVVSWKLGSGLLCSQADVVQVEITLYGTNKKPIGATETHPCDATFPNPTADDPDNADAGVLFDDLDEEADLTVSVYGLNKAGKKNYKGSIGGLELLPGTEMLEVRVPLESCADPCL
jgi:hypothetical protein